LGDKKRTPYVPLDSYVAFKRTGQSLKARWGMEGLCAWMLFLAACKREAVPGTFTYSSDDEAWIKLGARATLFSLDEFFVATGRLRQTRKRRSGHVTYVECVNWDLWTKDYKGQQASDRQARRRAPSDDMLTTSSPLYDESEFSTSARKTSKSQVSKRDTSVTLSRSKSSQVNRSSKGQSVVRPLGDDISQKTDSYHVERVLKAIGSSANGKTKARLRELATEKPAAAFELAREEIAKRKLGNPAGYAIRVIENYGADAA
jgi:hypothetical protein